MKDFKDKKTMVTIGGKPVLVHFNIPACRRVEQEQPGFNILNSKIPDFEIAPFLLRCGVAPEDAPWKDEAEFLKLYEDCKVEELSLVIEAYQNAVGFTNAIFQPTMEKIAKLIEEAKALDKKAKK